ncbi:hypothetical protein EW145_g832 [Phellinidium pouzarii]|uniref:SHSP domain-containing protein n=1 Tax=Phellinidium pouzarii TaxID=167371 RepID=A0A4S4LHG2_9AGAM|nr:hypothetical protein EW145_g832 [Phellinidium pouzarii]
MSLTRQFLREFRPLFRMLEEPFGRQHPGVGGVFARSSGSPFTVSNDPFFNSGVGNVPAVDVSEEQNAYVVEAELPGVKKENIDVRIGDSGQSLTIEGRTLAHLNTSPDNEQGSQAPQTSTSTSTDANGLTTFISPTGESQALTQSTKRQLSTERGFSSSSQFTRTIWLPHRVDGSGVAAKLADGILTLRIPKAEDQESVKVTID